MTIFFLILGALALSLATVLLFTRPSGSVVAAYVGAWAMVRSGYSVISGNTLLFWAIAVLIVVGIQMVRGATLRVPLRLRCFIAGGSLTLAVVGTLISSAGMVIGTVSGVVLGAVAGRTGNGWSLPAREFRYLLPAVGAPVVVAVCLIILSVAGLVLKSGITY